MTRDPNIIWRIAESSCSTFISHKRVEGEEFESVPAINSMRAEQPQISNFADNSVRLRDSIVNINQKGVWLGMKYAVPAMRKRGAGSIINISSIYGLIGSTGSTAYHGTKGAVRLITKSAAIQYAPDKIRVNSIHPGLILTPMLGVVTREELQPLIDATPLKRGAEPEEVGWCAVFLASDEASFVTGSELVVDGGYTAQ